MKYISYVITLLFLVTITACSDKVASKLVSEKYRPQLHFSPDNNWMNDPNGMVYYEGEYHLFYQHYPNGISWGPMHWGHAVSKDLIHWEHLPIALYPDSLGYIYSGSAIIDWKNKSGLGKNGIPPMIAIFTYHNSEREKLGKDDFQTQGLAYSLDKGRSWTKYDKNPILPNPGIRDFRDPKVIWSEINQKWYMILAVTDHVNIYSSSTLLTWDFESEFGKNVGSHKGVWECPDLFSMKIEGTNKTKWILLVSTNPGAPNGGSGTQYFVGDFDGHEFKNDGEKTKWIDYGKDNYAGVTWSDVPKKDGRRLFIGWMSNWQYAGLTPSKNWRGAATLPRSLELIENHHEYLLKSHPIEEFDKLRGKEKKIDKTLISNEVTITEKQELPIEIVLHFNTKDNTKINFAERFGIILSNKKNEKIIIGYDNLNKVFFIDKTKNGWDSPAKEFAQITYAPYINMDDNLDIRLIIDKSSVELFAKDGLVVMTDQFFPSEEYSIVSLFTEHGEIELTDGKITKLSSIWK